MGSRWDKENFHMVEKDKDQEHMVEQLDRYARLDH